MVDIDKVVRALVEAKPAGRNPRIRISYEITSEESAAEGDFKDQGWVDEEGVSMVPDEYDVADGKTAVELAIEFLQKEGVYQPSSSHFHTGIGYMTEPQQDFSSGDTESRSYHLVDFTEEEERKIFEGQGFLALPRTKGPTPEEFE